MDIRITNSCNNNCLYCLEQSYRTQEPFITLQALRLLLEKKERNDTSLTFYGGNPLLHPKLREIITIAQEQGFLSINILSNTFGIENILSNHSSKLEGIHFGFYFHSFHETRHATITNGGVSLKSLLTNISHIRACWYSLKAIIHVNKQNIRTLPKDIVLLAKRFSIQQIEFINYFPFDRAYQQYHELLRYTVEDERRYIDTLFRILQKTKISARFIKFEKQFFWDFLSYYNLEEWILWQMCHDDKNRIKDSSPSCKSPPRCQSCYIKDICRAYHA